MDTLITALYENGLNLKKASIEKLQSYLSLLERWNKVHSLTSVHSRDIPYVFAIEPLLFAEALSKYTNPQRCLDIGTGFGNPGVPISVYFKHADLLLVDSSTKKTALLRSALDMSNFENVKVITSRIENLPKEFEHTFDLAFSRGVGTVKKVSSYAIKFVKNDGFIAMLKAKVDKEEIPSTIGELKLESITTINVSYPSKKVRRYAVIYRKVKKS
jgi:16S rRNA (guanine527-N7)-methyltransferase